jgi:hypothetical protein
MTDIDLSQYKIWTEEEFERTFPPLPVPPRPNGNGTQGAAMGADNIDEATLPDDLVEFIRYGVSRSRDRSRMFMAVVAALKTLGYTAGGVYRLLASYPGGIAQKYLTPRDRLRPEVDRAYGKVATPAPAPPAPPVFTPAAPAAQSSPPSQQPLIDARAAFQKWLGEKYDTGVFDAVASAAAAERLGGDPLWLMVISGSGNAKTETVQSLSGAGALIASTISSEGALLAATARSHGATGGLLFKLGARGLLVFKDFTSILAMESKARGTMLAALREIHDGKYVRNVGFAGGRTLTWAGRIVVVAACTTAWDEARKVIETMGDRFVIVRSDSTTGRQESARQALGNTGREDAMRAELAGVMGALIASADLGVRKLDDAEDAQLVKLADAVTWARSGVERDYRGDVVNAHALEMPTRFSKQLGQLMRGAMSLGVSSEAAMRLATRCARDSLEPLRRDLLLDIAANPNSDPDEIRKRIVRPLTTVKQNLVALHALRLLECEEREEMRWRRPVVVPYYRLASEIDRATLLSM